MNLSRKPISRRGKVKLASWTFFGTLSCITVSVTYNVTAFWGFGHAAFVQAVISAIVLPIMLAAPLFFYLTLKLRETRVLNYRLHTLATLDGLTGCLNRSAFTHRVGKWLDDADICAARQSGALLLIDVDHFKLVNDQHGHLVGDEALKLIVRELQGKLRESDIVGRMGGEEFAVFLPGANADQAATVAERIRESIHQSRFAPTFEAEHKLSVSIGCVPFDGKISFTEIYKCADKLLYDAKHAGRNRIATAASIDIVPTNDDRPHDRVAGL